MKIVRYGLVVMIDNVPRHGGSLAQAGFGMEWLCLIASRLTSCLREAVLHYSAMRRTDLPLQRKNEMLGHRFH
jgi:hypothetical protein